MNDIKYTVKVLFGHQAKSFQKRRVAKLKAVVINGADETLIHGHARSALKTYRRVVRGDYNL